MAGVFGVSAVRLAAKGYKDAIGHVTTLGRLGTGTTVLGTAWTSRHASISSALVGQYQNARSNVRWWYIYIDIHANGILEFDLKKTLVY